MMRDFQEGLTGVGRYGRKILQEYWDNRIMNWCNRLSPVWTLEKLKPKPAPGFVERYQELKSQFTGPEMETEGLPEIVPEAGWEDYLWMTWKSILSPRVAPYMPRGYLGGVRKCPKEVPVWRDSEGMALKERKLSIPDTQGSPATKKTDGGRAAAGPQLVEPPEKVVPKEPEVVVIAETPGVERETQGDSKEESVARLKAEVSQQIQSMEEENEPESPLNYDPETPSSEEKGEETPMEVAGSLPPPPPPPILPNLNLMEEERLSQAGGLASMRR
jgi:hypothetical protein